MASLPVVNRTERYEPEGETPKGSVGPAGDRERDCVVPATGSGLEPFRAAKSQSGVGSRKPNGPEAPVTWQPNSRTGSLTRPRSVSERMRAGAGERKSAITRRFLLEQLSQHSGDVDPASATAGDGEFREKLGGGSRCHVSAEHAGRETSCYQGSLGTIFLSLPAWPSPSIGCSSIAIDGRPPCRLRT